MTSLVAAIAAFLDVAPAAPLTAPTANPLSRCAPLAIAQQYARLGVWSTAEEYYLKAAVCGDVNARNEALQGLARLPRAAPSTKPHGSLELAKLYEARGDWEDAGQHYADAVKGEDKAAIDEAVGGAVRMRSKLENQRFGLGWWTGEFDWWVGFLGRAVAFLLLIAAVVIFVGRWRSIVVRIVTTEDALARQTAFWFGHAHAMLRAEAMSRKLDLLHPPALVKSALPYISLPGLSDVEFDMDDVEVGGVKVSVSNLLKLARPRVQISAGSTSSEGTAHAYAEIAVRRWCVLKPRRVVSRSVSGSAGALDDGLELLVYEVLIEAVEAHAS